MNPYRRETIEHWVSDFCAGDGLAEAPPALKAQAPSVLVHFFVAACARADREPADLEAEDLAQALLEGLARLDLPPATRSRVPGLCADFIASLEPAGRLSGASLLAAQLRALGPKFQEIASGKPKPLRRPGSKLGRNDPCPCGSGKKYKRCCQRG